MFFCGEVGHIKRDCPKKRREVAGRNDGRNSLVTANAREAMESGDPLASFLDTQLEDAHRLHKEQALLSKTTVSAVNAEGETRTLVEVGALGHTLS